MSNLVRDLTLRGMNSVDYRQDGWVGGAADRSPWLQLENPASRMGEDPERMARDKDGYGHEVAEAIRQRDEAFLNGGTTPAGLTFEPASPGIGAYVSGNF